MTLLRPEIRAALDRWREMFVAAGVVVLGAWVATFSGWFYAGLGLLIALAGLAIGLIAWRRQRFRSSGLAPGVVQMIEGQVAYFGPEAGGVVSLRELEEVRLQPCAPGGRCWVLVPGGGEALEVPVAARDADVLYDAFATLPGIDMGALVAALDADTGHTRVVWRRRPRPALT